MWSIRSANYDYATAVFVTKISDFQTNLVLLSQIQQHSVSSFLHGVQSRRKNRLFLKIVCSVLHTNLTEIELKKCFSRKFRLGEVIWHFVLLLQTDRRYFLQLVTNKILFTNFENCWRLKCFQFLYNIMKINVDHFKKAFSWWTESLFSESLKANLCRSPVVQSRWRCGNGIPCNVYPNESFAVLDKALSHFVELNLFKKAKFSLNLDGQAWLLGRIHFVTFPWMSALFRLDR